MNIRVCGVVVYCFLCLAEFGNTVGLAAFCYFQVMEALYAGAVTSMALLTCKGGIETNQGQSRLSQVVQGKWLSQG